MTNIRIILHVLALLSFYALAARFDEPAELPDYGIGGQQAVARCAPTARQPRDRPVTVAAPMHARCGC